MKATNEFYPNIAVKMFEDKKFCDVTFIVEGISFIPFSFSKSIQQKKKKLKGKKFECHKAYLSC